jgi:hypothetical protein
LETGDGLSYCFWGISAGALQKTGQLIILDVDVVCFLSTPVVVIVKIISQNRINAFLEQVFSISLLLFLCQGHSLSPLDIISV